MATQPTQQAPGFSPVAAQPHFSEDGSCPCCRSPAYSMGYLHEECGVCGFSVDFDREPRSEH